jgi:hypothetical protein
MSIGSRRPTRRESGSQSKRPNGFSESVKQHASEFARPITRAERDTRSGPLTRQRARTSRPSSWQPTVALASPSEIITLPRVVN